MEPKIVERSIILLAGLPFYGDPGENAFGTAWERFVPHEASIAGRVDSNIFYGVEVYGPEFHQNHQWMYFPAVEVSELNVPNGILFGKALPACTYAVFTARGGLSAIPDTFKHAYDEWLPASGYELAHPFDFELYTERYKMNEPESEIDIYIPIKRKTT